MKILSDTTHQEWKDKVEQMDAITEMLNSTEGESNPIEVIQQALLQAEELETAQGQITEKSSEIETLKATVETLTEENALLEKRVEELEARPVKPSATTTAPTTNKKDIHTALDFAKGNKNTLEIVQYMEEIELI